MTYDEKLAEKIRSLLRGKDKVSEKKMFGGIAFLIDGKMFCGIIKEDLIVRTGPDNYQMALSKPKARVMDFTGKPMRGFVYVDKDGFKTTKKLEQWISLGLDYAASIEK